MFKPSRKIIVFAIATSFMLSANADINSEIAGCASEKNGVKRLLCFDLLSKKLDVSQPKVPTVAVTPPPASPTVLPAPAPAPKISKWRIDKETSKIDDSSNIFLMLEAESSISGWLNKTHTPELTIRCKEHKTEVYIETGMSSSVEYGTDGATVILRFDKEKAKSYNTGKSTDGEALFFSQSVGLIKQMLSHSTMLFQFTPFNSSPVMTTFDLSGISEAIKPLRETCKW